MGGPRRPSAVIAAGTLWRLDFREARREAQARQQGAGAFRRTIAKLLQAASPLPASAARRALRVHVERVDRLARGHEQAVALQAAEAEVGAALGQGDAADHDAVGGEYHDAVEFGIAHA